MNSAGASKAAARRMEHQYHRGKVEAQIGAALSSWPSMDQASRSLAWQLCNMPSRQHNFNPSAQVQRPPLPMSSRWQDYLDLWCSRGVLVLLSRLQKISFLSTRLFSLLKTFLPTKLLADI
eukprot:UN03868